MLEYLLKNCLQVHSAKKRYENCCVFISDDKGWVFAMQGEISVKKREYYSHNELRPRLQKSHNESFYSKVRIRVKVMP
jgi:hypothetical protein